MSVDRNAAYREMANQVGFREGPNNQNPYGPEQGISNAAYCNSFADIEPYHVGYRWWPESQFGEKGNAYVPTQQNIGQAHGEVRFDHASRGDPADLQFMDQVTFDWNGNGVADHIETVVAVYADGTFDTIGANTGSPNGVWRVRRDRRYLLARIRPSRYYDGSVPAPAPGPAPAPAPAPPPAPHAPDGNPFTPLVVDGGYGPQTKRALQWRLNVTEAYSHGPLVIDGDVGPATIRYLQQRLNWSNGPVAVDGQLGPQTVRALQRHTGAGVDGSWGPDTTRHLQAALNGGAF